MSINNRAYPRFEAKPGKWVKVAEKGAGERIFQLVDISRGGMSFLSFDAQEFKRGDKFVVVDFKDKKLQKKIIAVVRYVKINLELEGSTYTDYKVGVEFLQTTA
jgi:c-di-GMP-binding flagellar brake protein YcgR